jgi:hypothetical protein
MKPGMQRDILVAFWLLFDEFEIGDDGSPQEPLAPVTAAAPRATPQSPQGHPRPKANRSS